MVICTTLAGPGRRAQNVQDAAGMLTHAWAPPTRFPAGISRVYAAVFSPGIMAWWPERRTGHA